MGTFAHDLLRWYDRQRRDLPWRRRPTPYRTLVSEVMLQQTVVATVVPYFERFVARFPGFAALAAAREDEVLVLWSGLGYYARGRNLRHAAIAVVEQHGGRLPRNEIALRSLPGVGEYTAAAVAAIAFGARTFALDGNAARVMARLHNVGDPIAGPGVRARLRASGRALMPRTRAGDFMQAAMELGALICVPAGPRCPSCPVKAHCEAHRAGRAWAIPARIDRRPRRPVRIACALVVRAGRVLLVKRGARELLAGTWALPAKQAPRRGRSPEAAREAAAGAGVTTGTATFAQSVRHGLTHLDITADVFAVSPRGRVAAAPNIRWAAAADLVDLPLSTFARKTLRAGNFM